MTAIDGAIFLSAGIPDVQRGAEFAATAQPIAIAAAVSSLVYVALGRRRIVWGGHPSITPMVWAVAEELGVRYGEWVSLFQSRHFRDHFPEDNAKFQNVTYTEDLGERHASLLRMRQEMFSSVPFSAGVFIGGMQGILDEHDLFVASHPGALVIPIASSGGASLDLYRRLGSADSHLTSDLDYIGLLHRRLGIGVSEKRYESPADQPADMEQRIWQPEPRPRRT